MTLPTPASQRRWNSLRITGTVVSGQGVGTSATQLLWFRRSTVALYGFDPYPGTLNLHAAAPEAVESALLASGTLLVPPAADVCAAFLLEVELRVGGDAPDGRALAPACVRAVLVRPLVAGYPRGQMELVADRHLRRHLALSDGDAVTIVAAEGQKPKWFQALP